MARGSTSTLELLDDAEGGFEEDEFRLNLRIIEAAYPIAKPPCDTSDGCGSTCSGSACNSTANNPS